MTDMTDFAQALIAAHEAGRRFAPETAVPQSLEAAYAVQRQVSARFGPVGGFKTAQPPGAARFIAPIRADRRWPTGASVPVRDQLGVELELGFRVRGTDLGDSPEALARAVEPVVVIELVDTRLAGPLAEDPMVRLADCQLNHGLVVGPAMASWDGSDFSDVQARMLCGETLLVDGPAKIPGGSALAHLHGAVALARQLYGGVEPGQIVITGTLHPLTYFPSGTEVSGAIAGIGAVAVTLA